MGFFLFLMPTRTLESEKLREISLVTAMLSMLSRSRLSKALSKASSNSISESKGLYFGLMLSLV